MLFKWCAFSKYLVILLNDLIVYIAQVQYLRVILKKKAINLFRVDGYNGWNNIVCNTWNFAKMFH